MSEFNIIGNWNAMVPVRITLPEPVYNLIMEISKRRGEAYVTNVLRDFTIKGIYTTTGIDIMKININNDSNEQI
ncbi:MAG TPA: hypothetical protein PKU77_07610 [Ferruginibacter sp.]|jgi:hypothetical protein|nr:hypothetical protein [Ferruginibacter sp.]